MKKAFLSFAVVFLLAASAFAQGKAKYVFYFIGDGMGVNQVNATETYQADLKGRIGTLPLCFAGFPYTALVTTQSATNGVTDSAAGGTALACGQKTKNGVLGMLQDQQTPITSIAVEAQRAGAAVGITTSVSVDHATPAAFYAHVPSRNEYYEVGKQLIASGFDFFGGAGFHQPTSKKDLLAGTLYEQAARGGYTVVNTYDECMKQARKAGKMLLVQGGKKNPTDGTALNYAIDRSADDLTLEQITRAAVSFLENRKKEGFFLMVEGGKIDYACHANDAAACVREVQDLDAAVKVAYEFYKRHADETLIVVTADHETGGIALGRGPYELHTALLQYQRMSTERYTHHLKQLREENPQAFTWERVAEDLRENWGFDGAVKLTDKQRARLRAAYDRLVEGQDKGNKNLYSSLDGLSDCARAILAEQALVGWQSGGHSNGYVPVFAIGAGAEAFSGRLDNTQIPRFISRAAGW